MGPTLVCVTVTEERTSKMSCTDEKLLMGEVLRILGQTVKETHAESALVSILKSESGSRHMIDILSNLQNENLKE